MEEFIFDDDVDDVGAEIEANCPKCRADTTHVVVSKYEDEVRRVQCNPCGDVHTYRKPRGDSEEEPEPSPKKKAAKAKPTWDQVMAKNKKPPRPYAIGDYFKEMELLTHPKFGVGFVTDNIGEDKIEVTFKDDKRVLVHNRKNLSLPFLRPVATPATPKKAKVAAVAAPAAPSVKAPSAKTASPPARAATKPAAPVARGAHARHPNVAKPRPQSSQAKAQAKAKAPAAKHHVKSTARAAAKKPASAKPVKKIKKSR